MSIRLRFPQIIFGELLPHDILNRHLAVAPQILSHAGTQPFHIFLGISHRPKSFFRHPALSLHQTLQQTIERMNAVLRMNCHRNMNLHRTSLADPVDPIIALLFYSWVPPA